METMETGGQEEKGRKVTHRPFLLPFFLPVFLVSSLIFAFTKHADIRSLTLAYTLSFFTQVPPRSPLHLRRSSARFS